MGKESLAHGQLKDKAKNILLRVGCVKVAFEVKFRNRPLKKRSKRGFIIDVVGYNELNDSPSIGIECGQVMGKDRTLIKQGNRRYSRLTKRYNLLEFPVYHLPYGSDKLSCLNEQGEYKNSILA